MELDKISRIEDIAKRRGFFWISSEVHGGLSGFYDYAHLGTAMKRKWENLICIEITRHRIKPVAVRAELEFFWCEPDKRRDPDNIAAGKKFILDALVLSGVLPKDSQRWVKKLSDEFVEPNPKDPGVCVVIRQDGGISGGSQ